MSGAEIQKVRVINELRAFIKKLLQDPQILEQSLTITRRAFQTREQTQLGASDREVLARIASEISDTTSVHIPENADDHSEADKLYLEMLKEVIDEEQALY